MMRITDPLWPAVREVSRRVLKASKVNFVFPEQFEQQIHIFDLSVQEHLPSRIESSLFTTSTSASWSIQSMQGSLIASQTKSDDLSYVFIPLPCERFLQDFLNCCEELLRAGYPGCEDCIQDVRGSNWDEELNRNQLRQDIE
jgi:hypothetical protein